MNIPFTLRELEVFVETARLSHLTQAAERLHLTQSAASTALRNLEHALGGQLFHRAGRRLSLNDRGRLLYPQAQAVLASAQVLYEAASGVGEGLRGHLVLACSTTIGNYVVPSRLAAFKTLYPGVEVTLRIGNSGDVASMLHDLQADVGIVEGDVDDPLIEQQEWMEDELVVIAAPDSSFAGRAALDWSELADEQWLTREQGSGTLRTLQRALEHDHVRLAHAHELGHTEAIKRAVESGLGLSCLSRLAVQRELESGTLITIPLRQPLRRWFRILTLPSDARPCGARAAFLDWLRQP